MTFNKVPSFPRVWEIFFFLSSARRMWAAAPHDSGVADPLGPDPMLFSLLAEGSRETEPSEAEPDLRQADTFSLLSLQFPAKFGRTGSFLLLSEYLFFCSRFFVGRAYCPDNFLQKDLTACPFPPLFQYFSLNL